MRTNREFQYKYNRMPKVQIEPNTNSVPLMHKTILKLDGYQYIIPHTTRFLLPRRKATTNASWIASQVKALKLQGFLVSSMYGPTTSK